MSRPKLKRLVWRTACEKPEKEARALASIARALFGAKVRIRYIRKKRLYAVQVQFPSGASTTSFNKWAEGQRKGEGNG